MTPSTTRQRQLIKIAQRKLGIADEDYRGRLMEEFGVDSSTKLTSLQAARFIRILGGMGFRKTRQRKGHGGAVEGAGKRKRPMPRRSGNMIRLASAEELEKIDALAGLIAWKFDDGLSRWMQKRLAIDRVRTAMDAYRVIEGLKAMFENKMKARFGKDWYLRQFKEPGIYPAEVLRYIEEHK